MKLLAVTLAGIGLIPCGYAQTPAANSINNSMQIFQDSMNKAQAAQTQAQQQANLEQQNADRKRAQEASAAQKRDEAARNKTANPFGAVDQQRTTSAVATESANPFGAATGTALHAGGQGPEGLVSAPDNNGSATSSRVEKKQLDKATVSAYPRGGRYQLLIGSDLACSVKVDDGAPTDLAPDEPLIIKVAPGDHLLTVVSRDGKDKWRTVVDVDKPSKAVLIPLAGVKQAREQGVRAVQQDFAQAQQQVRAAATRSQQQAQAAADRDAKRKQIADIQSQINDLREQAETDQEAAQFAEQEAQMSQQSCANLPAGVRCNYQAAASGMNQIMANQKRQEIQRINVQISELQAQMQMIANQ
jgi:hypothetical protein